MPSSRFVGLDIQHILQVITIPSEVFGEIADDLTSTCQLIGLQEVDLSEISSETSLARLADWLRTIVGPGSMCLEEARATPFPEDGRILWHRLRWRFPGVYFRRLTTASGSGASDLNSDAGELRIQQGGSTPLPTPAELREHSAPAGLGVNVLDLPMGATGIDLVLRPIPFGRRPYPLPLDDPALEHSIANAYWQTRWAEGGLRVARGHAEPVVFVPVSTSPALENDDADVCEIEPGRWLVGAEAALRFTARRLAEKDYLKWSMKHDALDLSNSVPAVAKAAKLEEGRISRCLDWLRSRCFLDRYIGQNAAFAREAGSPAAVPDDPPIGQVVFVSGSDLLSRAVARHEKEKALIAAAINSVFFLNFPEEYASLHCSMNDLVALTVVDGEIWQPPLYHRGTLLLDSKGQAQIRVTSMRDLQVALPWWTEMLEHREVGEGGFSLNAPTAPRGDEIGVYTPVIRSGPARGQGKTPPHHGLDLVIVHGAIQEIGFGGKTKVPANGFVVAIPPIDPDRLRELLERHGRAIQMRLDPALGDVSQAVAVGPILLAGGRAIAPDFFDHAQTGGGTEEFAARGADGAPAGVVPTRFPHDTQRTRAPRTALGITEHRRILLVTVDGRNTSHSIGLTLRELANLMKMLGCRDALNLDGGGSTAMFINQTWAGDHRLDERITPGIVNMPADAGFAERLLPAPLFLKLTSA